jgi:hypothetical protein
MLAPSLHQMRLQPCKPFVHASTSWFNACGTQQIMLRHQAELEAAKKIMESISGQVTFILTSQNIFHLLSPEF